jgi:tetratricopeptide (TPR) repeat protein
MNLFSKNLRAGVLLCCLGTLSARGAAQNVKSGPDFTEAQKSEMQNILAESHSAMARRDFDAAIAGFRKLVAMAPQIAEFHANLGMSYYSSGRLPEAVTQFREALKLKPSLDFPHYFLGEALAEEGQCGEALGYLEKDYSRVKDPHLKHLLGMDALKCADSANNVDKTLDMLRLLSRDFPEDPDVLYYSSHIYSTLATRASQTLLSVAPSSYQAHQFNAEVLALQGKYDDALAEYRKVLALQPGLEGIHYSMGEIYLEEPRTAETLASARREFEEELKISPASAGSEYQLGEMAREARQWDAAIGHFTRAIQIQNNYVDAMIGLGKSLVSAGRPEEAVEPLQRAVRIAPGNPVAHYQLAFAYRRIGRGADAERELALYQKTHEEDIQSMMRIRTGIQGQMPQGQTAEPPE